MRAARRQLSRPSANSPPGIGGNRRCVAHNATADARFALTVDLQPDVAVPWGSLGANLLGCLVMCMLAHLIAHSQGFNDAGFIPDQYRLLFAIGFCGSFTTLSTMVMELNTMLQRNELFYSFTYLFSTLVGGFACFSVGFAIVRSLRAAL